MGTKRIIISATGLSQERIKYYSQFGFQSAYIVPIGKQKQELFLIRKQGHESAVHTYIVEMIKQFLIQHNLRPRRWITKGVDLSVRQRFSKKRLAIEVETGQAYRINKKQLLMKFTNVQKVFDVLIVLTDSFYLKRYQKLFPNIPILLRQQIMSYLLSKLPQLGYPRERHKFYTPKNKRVPFWFFRRRNGNKKIITSSYYYREL
jgi:uncharacterized protein YjhX (UPF0386 family)